MSNQQTPARRTSLKELCGMGACDQLGTDVVALMKKTTDNQDKVIINQQSVIIKYAQKVKDLKQLLHLVERKLKVGQPVSHQEKLPEYVEQIRKMEFEEISLSRIRSLNSQLAQCKRDHRCEILNLCGEKQMIQLELKNTQIALNHAKHKLQLANAQISNEKVLAISSNITPLQSEVEPEQRKLLEGKLKEFEFKVQELTEGKAVVEKQRDAFASQIASLKELINELNREKEEMRRGQEMEMSLKELGIKQDQYQKIKKLEETRKSLNSSFIEETKEKLTEVSDYDSEVDFETDFQFRRSGSTLSRTPYRENESTTLEGSNKEVEVLRDAVGRLETENSELKVFKKKIEDMIPEEVKTEQTMEEALLSTFDKLEQFKSLKVSQEEDLEKFKSETEQLKKENEELKGNLDARTTNDSKEKNNDYDQITEELEEMRRQNQEYAVKITELEREIKAQEMWYEQKLEFENKRIRELEQNQLDRGQEFLELIKKENKSHESNLNDLSSSLKLSASECRGDKLTYKEEIEKLNSHINFLLLELQNSQKENRRLKSRHSFSSSKARSLKKDEILKKAFSSAQHHPGRRSSMNYTLNSFHKQTSLPNRDNLSANQFFQCWCASSHNIYQKSELLECFRESAFTQHECLQRKEVFFLIVEECFGPKSAQILKRKMILIVADLIGKHWLSHSDLFKLSMAEVFISQIKLQNSKVAFEKYNITPHSQNQQEILFASLKLLLHLFSFDRNITSWKYEQAQMLRGINGLKTLYTLIKTGYTVYGETNYVIFLKFIGLLAESECHSEELLKFELHKFILNLINSKRSTPLGIRRAAAESYALLLLDNQILSSIEGHTEIELLITELLNAGDDLLAQKLLDCFLNLSVASPLKLILNNSQLTCKLLKILDNCQDLATQGVVFQIIYNLSHDHTTKVKHFKLISKYITQFLTGASNQYVNLGLTLLRRLLNVSKSSLSRHSFEDEIMRPRLDVLRPLIHCVKTKNLENKALAVQSIYRICSDYPDCFLKLFAKEKLLELIIKCYKFKITLKVMHWSSKLLILFCEHGYLKELFQIDEEGRFNMLQEYIDAVQIQNSLEIKSNGLLLLSFWAAKTANHLYIIDRISPAEISAILQGQVGSKSVNPLTLGCLRLVAELLLNDKWVNEVFQYSLIKTVLDIIKRKQHLLSMSESKQLLTYALMFIHNGMKAKIFGRSFVQELLKFPQSFELLSKLKPFSNEGARLLTEIWNSISEQMHNRTNLTLVQHQVESNQAVAQNLVSTMKQTQYSNLRIALKRFTSLLKSPETRSKELLKMND